ncbi:hypothetical protein HDU97_006802 [Phlyctochytrium planicorne]|nr:hypothetical protein HDU97_006802 [Phlyctochytrium planicorne]
MTMAPPVSNDTTLSSLQQLSFARMRDSLLKGGDESIEHLTCWDNPVLGPKFPHLGYLAASKVIDEGEPPEAYNDITKLHQHFDQRELELRKLFATDRQNQLLDDPFVGLEEMFVDGGQRHFRKREVWDGGLYYVFKEAAERVSANEDLTVTSLERFKSNFEALTHGLFKHVNFDNLFVAGGAVVAALQPSVEGVNESNYFNSDIDVFLYGLELEQVRMKVVEIYEGIMKAVTGNVEFVNGDEISDKQPDDKSLLCVRNVRSMIFVGKYPRRQIQVVFRLFKSPAEILMGFDIDSCCFGYNGKNIYTLPRGLRALTHRYNLEYRLFKYAKRGFAVAVPNVNAAKIANKNRINTGQGLSRLLSLEARQLLPGYHRTEFRYEEGKLERTEIVYADRNAEKMEQGDRFSHYQIIKIPYGEKWVLKRIEKFVKWFRSKAGYAILYGPMEGVEYKRPEWIKKRRKAEYVLAKSAETGTSKTSNHEHPESNTTDDEEIDSDDASSQDSMSSDVNFDHPPIVITRNEISSNLDEHITEYLDDTFHYLKFEDCWMTENPGAQLLTGSFKPVETTWEEWCRDAYDGSLPERNGNVEERFYACFSEEEDEDWDEYETDESLEGFEFQDYEDREENEE